MMWAIVGARVFDGSGEAPLDRGVVLVGGDGRIVAVGREGEVAVPGGARHVDGRGLFLMPGLIDGHQHLTWDKTLYTAHLAGGEADPLCTMEARLVRAGHFAQSALAAGVTTVRDCGANDYSVLALRDAIDSGYFTGPRILAAGRPITTTAGHLYTDWGADSVEEIRKAVRLVAHHGADFVKLVASGGTTSPGTNITRAQYSLEELRAAVLDAHRLGLPVAVHAISTDSILLAAEAGVDAIEHCSWIGSDPGTVVTDRHAVELMVKNNVCVDHAIIPRPFLFAGHDGERTTEEQWWFEMLEVRWPFLHYMREQGVTVYLGTDAAYGPWPGTDCWPGFQDLARAVEIMVRWAGFSPEEALAMVTGEAAMGLQIAEGTGTLAAGKRADMILLREDPLVDIRALRHVEMVFRDGTLVAERGRLVLPGYPHSGTGDALAMGMRERAGHG